MPVELGIQIEASFARIFLLLDRNAVSVGPWILANAGDNTASGFNSLEANNNTGNSNTASGAYSLFGNTAGYQNAAFGVNSLSNSSTGFNNTAVGFNSLLGNGTGSANTALGYKANVGISSGTNATAIGANAEVDESNALVLGSISGLNGATASTSVGIGIAAPAFKLHIGLGNNDFRVEGPPSGTTNPLMASFGGNGDVSVDAPGIPGGRFIVKDGGRVGIGISSPDNTLTVFGTADKPGGGSWGVFSDGRLKEVRGNFSAGLSEILKLHPVRYQYKKENAMGIHDSDEHVGFVAQEVEQAIPDAVTRNEKGYLLVNNDTILWAMLNAIKEQQREIARLRQRDRVLESRLARIEGSGAAARTPRLAIYQAPVGGDSSHRDRSSR